MMNKCVHLFHVSILMNTYVNNYYVDTLCYTKILYENLYRIHPRSIKFMQVTTLRTDIFLELRLHLIKCT